MRRILTPVRVYATSVATVESSVADLSLTDSSLPLSTTLKRVAPVKRGRLIQGLKAVFRRRPKVATTTDVPLFPISASSTGVSPSRTRSRRRISALPRPLSPSHSNPTGPSKPKRAKAKKPRPAKPPTKRQIQKARLDELTARSRNGEVLGPVESWELKDLTLSLLGGI